MQGGVDAAYLFHSKRGSCKTPSLAHGHPNTARVFTNTLSKPNREFHCPHCTHVTRTPALQFQGEPCQRTHSASYTREAQKQIWSTGEEKKIKNINSAAHSCCSQNSLQVGLWWGLTLKGTERYWQTWSKQDPSVCTHFIATSTKWEV